MKNTSVITLFFALIVLSSSAWAEEKWSIEQVRKSVFSDKTVHWRVINRNINGVSFYASDGTFYASCCKKDDWRTYSKGTWKIIGNEVCLTWQAGPSRFVGKTRCSQYRKSASGVETWREGRRKSIFKKIENGDVFKLR